MPAVWIPYCGSAPIPAELMQRWNLDPVLLVVLALVIGAGLTRSVSVARGPFLAGMAILVLLFVSPICALTSALFLARTVHHIALTTIAAPLLAAALSSRRGSGGLAAWTGVHAVTFWLWHVPAAYEAALSNTAIYWLMQLSLLLTAIAMWRAILAASAPAAIGALLATMVQMGLLGALLTFTGSAIYLPHLAATLAWNLSPLEDQQLAGLIMWAPGAALYLGAALLLLSRWFAAQQRPALSA